jgi:hypothetical protein
MQIRFECCAFDTATFAVSFFVTTTSRSFMQRECTEISGCRERIVRSQGSSAFCGIVTTSSPGFSSWDKEDDHDAYACSLHDQERATFYEVGRGYPGRNV